MTNSLTTLTVLFTAAIAALAWAAFAEHPTAANLRRAIADTLPLI